MMASNIFSRMTGRSFYEELRGERDGPYDVDDRAGLLDEDNLNHDFHDHDLERAEQLGVNDSHSVLGEPTNQTGRGRGRQSTRFPSAPRSSRWPPTHDEVDNDVPASLLIEHHHGDGEDASGSHLFRDAGHGTTAVPGPSRARAHWETAQAQQRLHSDDIPGLARRDNATPGSFLTSMVSGNARKMAEWRWANVSNLDNFILEVYDYYTGCGLWCILLERALHLMSVPAPFVARDLVWLTCA